MSLVDSLSRFYLISKHYCLQNDIPNVPLPLSEQEMRPYHTLSFLQSPLLFGLNFYSSVHYLTSTPVSKITTAPHWLHCPAFVSNTSFYTSFFLFPFLLLLFPHPTLEIGQNRWFQPFVLCGNNSTRTLVLSVTLFIADSLHLRDCFLFKTCAFGDARDEISHSNPPASIFSTILPFPSQPPIPASPMPSLPSNAH